MIWLAFPSVFILAVRFFIVLANLWTKPYLRSGNPEGAPGISVLIPARNEEQNLGNLLEDLAGQEFLPVEILVCDDASTDRTPEIIEHYSGRYPFIRGIRAGELPGGWSGKNHACHRLAMEATGEYLLFLDADVRCEPELTGRAVRHVREHSLTLLSIFPQQTMRSAGEMFTVPVMNWILLSLLPLRMVKSSRWPAFSAANGQMMLFDGADYRRNRFHEAVKGIPVEDIAIVRQVKRRGMKAETLLGRGEIRCRMYHSYREGILGLTRSLYAFFGGSGAILLIFSVFATFGPVFALLGFSPAVALAYLGVAALMRMAISRISRQPAGKLLAAVPVIHFSFLWMVLKAFIQRARGTSSWKGRTIQFRNI